jgi:hypothetical protein
MGFSRGGSRLLQCWAVEETRSVRNEVEHPSVRRPTWFVVKVAAFRDARPSSPLRSTRARRRQAEDIRRWEREKPKPGAC